MPIRRVIIGTVLVLGACLLCVPGLREPRHQEKTVGHWFAEYASIPANAQVQDHTSLENFRYVGQGYGGRVLADTRTRHPLPDPALDAFHALGSRAVPSLTRRLRPGFGESPTVARIWVRLPEVLRVPIPNPWGFARRRAQAVEILASLGPEAKDAIPALVSLMESQPNSLPGKNSVIPGGLGKFQIPRSDLYQLSPTQTGPIAAAIVSILQDPGARARLIRDLARQRHYRSAVELIEVSEGYEPGVPEILGNALSDPNPAVRRKAMRLLEKLGAQATAAIPQVLSSLQDPDDEVRWLAARTLESGGTNNPAIIAGLHEATRDTNILVRTVATRALSRLIPDPTQAR